MDGPFDDIRNGAHVTKNSALADEMVHVIKTLFTATEPIMGKLSLLK